MMKNNQIHLSMVAFSFAALTPVPLLGLGAVLGGAWLWAGFLYMAVLCICLDQFLPLVESNAPEGAEFPAADALLVAIGLSGLWMMAIAVWAIAGASDLTLGQRILLFLGCGYWLGQVGHPAAHELIHRGHRGLFRLGQSFYGAILFGQHASAHRLVHHIWVATNKDPNSAREGEGFYRFALRAWVGSFVEGARAETALRKRSKTTKGLHPYVWLWGGSAFALVLAAWIAGLAGALVWIGLALHAQTQILVSDYVQHYGLRRKIDASGRPEPLGPAHSWNSAHWFSSAMMLNAPRHSDHHIHPARPYPALRLEDADIAPQLPWPLPLACAIAFIPPLWKRRIRPHLRRWQPQIQPATPNPKHPLGPKTCS